MVRGRMTLRVVLELLRIVRLAKEKADRIQDVLTGLLERVEDIAIGGSNCGDSCHQKSEIRCRRESIEVG